MLYQTLVVREAASDSTNHKMGDIRAAALIEVKPSRTSLLCEGRKDSLVAMSVGCPPSRHIRLRTVGIAEYQV